MKISGRVAKIHLLVAFPWLLRVHGISAEFFEDPPLRVLDSHLGVGTFLQTKNADSVEAPYVSEKEGLIDTISDIETAPVINFRTFPKQGIELVDVASRFTLAEPDNLEQYCAGVPTKSEKDMELKPGTPVKADWMKFGKYYPGEITSKNANGTVNIHYEDGFDEEHVDPSNVKIVKTTVSSASTESTETEQSNSRRDDPACELQDSVKALKTDFADLNSQMQKWLLAQRAKVAQGKHPEPPPTMASMNKEPAKLMRGAPAPAVQGELDVEGSLAPAPAAPDGVSPVDEATRKSQEIDALKEELANADKRIEELELEVRENDEALEVAYEEHNESPAPALTTIDALIDEYKAKVAERHAKIKKLEAKVKEQEMELARLGAMGISLEDISADARKLAEESEHVVAKRDFLEKEGKLDEELAVIVDGIVGAIEKLQGKVQRLVAVESKAKAQVAYADNEVKTAVRLAESKAKAQGKSPEEVKQAGEEAAAITGTRVATETRAVEVEALKAAQDVNDELKEGERYTEELDTGLHPHGAKWWRYRYEHSYIEALCMIFIVILYLIWNVLVAQLQALTVQWSLPPGTTPKTIAEKAFKERHGGKMYSLWLKCLAQEMLVCILVFLTVWVISKTPLFYVLPQLIMPAKDMRVPTHGDEYLRLAVEICTIFFFAILFYFYLMLSVCHSTISMTSDLEKFHQRKVGSLSRINAGGLASNLDEWHAFEAHAKSELEVVIAQATSPVFVDIRQALETTSFSEFPLHLYLKLNIRVQVFNMLSMDWILWLPVVVAFAAFMILHRCAHMGYVRIMFFFSFCTILIILWMYWHTQQFLRAIRFGGKPLNVTGLHAKYNTEFFWMCTLRFVLFFLCYGVARMICQTWLWQLHFWPVFWLTISALVGGVLFVFLVAPIIPAFCAAMAIPPYVGPHNAEMILVIAQGKETPVDQMDSAR